MKHYKKIPSKIFLSLIILCTAFSGAFAQGPPQKGKMIPADPSVRTGTLANGMKYYIKQNKEPENRAELRLAVNAGSILEDKDQLGLAHFVEHMAFNGTKHFSKSELVDYLESVGVKFGPHLNAYTSFDETVYMLQLATDDQEIMDKGMLILQDWAQNVTFDHEEIDKERGVVIEEWRMRSGADSRMMEQYMPVLTNNSHYADRIPIGKVDILKNFKYETIKRFYDKWYRPDLMAIIAVGDFDLDKMEAKVKAEFSKVKVKPNAGERPTFDIDDHKDFKASVATDPEAQFTMLQIAYKHENRTYKTEADYRDLLVEQLASGMVNDRLDELKQSGKVPLLFSGTRNGQLFGMRSKSAFSLFALMSPNGVKDGIRKIMEELERARRHGFIETELERQKTKMLTNMETQFKEKDKTESRRHAGAYVQSYLNERPFPSVEWRFEKYKELLPGIKLEEVNAIIKSWVRNENAVVVLTGAEKEGEEFPSDSEILQMHKDVMAAKIDPYKEVVDDRPLMAKMPEPGKVTEVKKQEKLGITEFQLSNGARVILKPTEFKDDEIKFSAFSYGGTSRFSDSDYESAWASSGIVSQSGVGKFKDAVLKKKLADKIVFLRPWISDLQEGMMGQCAPKDLETMLQLVHLYFTEPRQDKDGFNAFKQSMKAFAAMSNSPEGTFRDSVTCIMSGNHPRRQPLTDARIDKISHQVAYMSYLDRFMDASDFDFVLVGNFDPETVKPLIEKYLGGLPGMERTEKWKDLGIKGPKGVVHREFKMGTAEKAMVNIAFTGPMEFNSDNIHEMNSMIAVLRIMLRESMREDKGGVYGVRASASPKRYPKEGYRIDISFTCAPDRVDELVETAMKDIKDLSANGASEKNLQKVQETQRRSYETDMKDNDFWVKKIEFYYENAYDPSHLLSHPKLTESLTTKQLGDAAKRYLNMENYVKIVMKPEK